MEPATYNWMKTNAGLRVQRIENGRVIDALAFEEGHSTPTLIYHFPAEYRGSNKSGVSYEFGGRLADSVRSESSKVNRCVVLEKALRSRAKWEEDTGIRNLPEYIGRKVIIARGVAGNPVFETTKGILLDVAVDGFVVQDVKGISQTGYSLNDVTRIIPVE